MEETLISVIIPVCNIEEPFRICMDSLLRQSYTDLEFIIVDDGSEENCGKLYDSFGEQDERVVVYHKENGGVADARNFGIERSRGEYIAFVDADDFVDADYVEYLFRLLKKHKARMSLCQHRVVFRNRVLDHGSSMEDRVMDAGECLEKMCYHDVIDTSAIGKLYHRSLFDDIHYPKGKWYEDMGTTYRLFIESERIAVGFESKYNYCTRSDSIVRSEFSAKKLELIEMTDRMAEEVLLQYPGLEDAVRCRKVNARFSTLNQTMGMSGCKGLREDLIAYIKENGEKVLKDKKAGIKDKTAIRLLRISYALYSAVWRTNQHINHRSIN